MASQALALKDKPDSPESPPPSPSSQFEDDDHEEAIESSETELEKETNSQQLTSAIGLPLKRGTEGAQLNPSTSTILDIQTDVTKKQFKPESFYDQKMALKTKFVNSENGENLLLLSFPSMVFIGYQVKDERGGLTRSAICLKMNEIPQVLDGVKKINQLFLELIKKKDENIHVDEEIDFTERKAGFKVVARINQNFDIVLYRAWRPIDAPGKVKSFLPIFTVDMYTIYTLCVYNIYTIYMYIIYTICVYF